jgi:hypothetical protein
MPASNEINIHGNVTNSTIIIGDKNVVEVAHHSGSNDIADFEKELIKLLISKNRDLASEKLVSPPLGFQQSGMFHILTAMAIMTGRSCNALSLNERGLVEKELLKAREQLGEASILPALILAIIEIDYYNYHGRVSKNRIDVLKVSQQLADCKLNESEIGLVKSISATDLARKQLDLDALLKE